MSTDSDSSSRSRVRVGILGFGKLGQFLAKEVLQRPETFDLVFVWNRTSDKVKADEAVASVCLENIEDAESRKPDLIIEVAHPKVLQEHGAMLLAFSHVLVGSPTAFADKDFEASMRALSSSGSKGVFVPSGAFWGAKDIQKMADRGTLWELRLTMKKHPSSFKLESPLKEKNADVSADSAPVTLYEGPVRALCPLAPNNVNTMACGALAAHNLGFDKVSATLVSDPSLTAHIVEIEAYGPLDGDSDKPFSVKTVRYNPAKVGAVTGNATYNSFLSSLLSASEVLRPGFHFC